MYYSTFIYQVLFSLGLKSVVGNLLFFSHVPTNSGIGGLAARDCFCFSQMAIYIWIKERHVSISASQRIEETQVLIPIFLFLFYFPLGVSLKRQGKVTREIFGAKSIFFIFIF